MGASPAQKDHSKTDGPSLIADKNRKFISSEDLPVSKNLSHSLTNNKGDNETEKEDLDLKENDVHDTEQTQVFQD